MGDWEEIKRLAADFQKIQLSSTSQKLSERNCIEIITWLKEKKLLDLIFTVDGKEFLTTTYLVQEIKNELYVNGGRINLVDLAKNIGVDLGHINNHMKEVLKSQKDLQFILGQLIDSTYITKIAGEINEKLSQQGQINISDLTIAYDLPADFLQAQVFDKFLGKLIHGKQDASDPQFYFTETFIARCKAKIRGALIGLTRPTLVSSILNHISVTEKLFFSLFDQISVPGQLTCRLVGAQYVPNIYAKSQTEWVSNFFKQNGYLEFDSLLRLGISDCKTYIRKLFDDVIFLNSCATSRRTLEALEADIEECIASKSYLDLQINLPSVFNDKDVALLIDFVLSGTKKHQSRASQLKEQFIVINNKIIISQAFVDNLVTELDEICNDKAKICVESGQYQEHQTDLQVSLKSTGRSSGAGDPEERTIDKREERRKKAAAGGKSGGGTQGRESKTKSTKKSNRGGGGKQSFTAEDDIDDSPSDLKPSLSVISRDDIQTIIQDKLMEDLDEDIIDEFIEYFLPKLNEKAIKKAGELYATLVTDQTATLRQTHNELQDKLNTLIGQVRMFEKGLKLLSTDEDLQNQLSKYLIKTIGNDIASEILGYVAAEQNRNVQNIQNLNQEQKLKLVNELPADSKKSLLPLVKSLTGNNIDEFMTAAEEGLAACGMIIKKIDKKKDRLVVLNHKHNLQEQLDTCEDLALVLHLAVLIIFTSATQAMVHASGRHVATILAFLKQYLREEDYAELASYHDFVTLMLSGGSEAENAKEKLKEKMASIKTIATTFKKPSAEKV